MADDNKTKTGKTREQLKIEKEELKQLIIQYADADTLKRGTDEHLDREKLKVELQGGREFWISEVEKFMKARAREVGPRFKLEYYEEIFRLRGWEIEKAKEFVKPADVAIYTTELIYGRFKPEILEALQILNPYLPGRIGRAYWHYQFFNADGLLNLELYIDEAIALMKTCTTWHQCRVEFHKQYGIPYQMDMFDDNGNIKKG